MNIPFYNIKRVYQKHSKEIINTVASVYSGGNVLMGAEVEELEKKVSRICGRKYALAVGSCTDALFFALKSAGIGKGDEVLVTSFSYTASVTPILRAGAVPVFVDIEPNYFMMDLPDLVKKITGRTKAIVAVHLFGQMLPIDKLEEIAKRNDLVLIEDAAQSLGSEYNGRKAGSAGLCSCISFDPSKIIGAFGCGGVFLSDDEAVYKMVKKLRFHGKNMENGEFEILGYNSRMATSQAALVLLQLNWLENWIEKRNEIAAIYNRELNMIKEIKIPEVNNGNSHTYHKYVIQVKNRDKLRKHLTDNGIQTMTHYNKALYEHPLFDNYKYRAANISLVHQIKNKALSIPIYPELKSEEVQYICEVIKTF